MDIVTVDGESLVHMKPGDYLIYNPSSSMNAMEVPIKPLEGTTPGIILYVEVGESIEESSLELDYTFHRLLTSDVLFWVSLGLLALWLIALLVYMFTSAQIRRYQERHERDNEIINESIETFTGFIDAKDPYTNGHSKRVARYTRMIAKEFGYDGEDLDRIYYMALLHDCGKIGVPDNILGKPGTLTEEEFEIIKSHTVRGSEILSSFKSLDHADLGARYHHERFDGKGYPEGKSGDDIPFIARMICVADSFDAMNSDRVYRRKLSRDRILSEIEENKGKQFDPTVADVMLGLLKDGKIACK
jgi:HD-GYP domain-containing protein (c-di-GMP phosphodiesterase class II)